MRKPRVYLAGPYRSPDIIGILNNIRSGLKTAAILISQDYTVFCPWTDFLYVLAGFGPGVDVQQLQDNSMAWLEVSDIVFVLHGWENSEGTKEEIKRANELGIPVVYSSTKLGEWRSDHFGGVANEDVVAAGEEEETT